MTKSVTPHLNLILECFQIVISRMPDEKAKFLSDAMLQDVSAQITC